MSDPVTRTDAAEELLPADEPPDAPVPWQRSDAESMRPAEDGEGDTAHAQTEVEVNPVI